MTFEIYAAYPEGIYKVAEATSQEHGLDFAAKICKQFKQWPYGFVSFPSGKIDYKGSVFTLEDLKVRK